MGFGWLVVDGSKLIAVDGGCKRSYPGRYLKQFPRQMLIELAQHAKPFLTGWMREGSYH